MASLRDADLKKKLGARESEERIVKAQHRLLALRLQMGGLIGDGTLGPPLCILFEGWDAPGKGGQLARRDFLEHTEHVEIGKLPIVILRCTGSIQHNRDQAVLESVLESRD